MSQINYRQWGVIAAVVLLVLSNVLMHLPAGEVDPVTNEPQNFIPFTMMDVLYNAAIIALGWTLFRKWRT